MCNRFMEMILSVCLFVFACDQVLQLLVSLMMYVYVHCISISKEIFYLLFFSLHCIVCPTNLICSIALFSLSLCNGFGKQFTCASMIHYLSCFLLFFVLLPALFFLFIRLSACFSLPPYQMFLLTFLAFLLFPSFLPSVRSSVRPPFSFHLRPRIASLLWQTCAITRTL